MQNPVCRREIGTLVFKDHKQWVDWLAEIYCEISRRFIDSSTPCWLLTVPDRSQDVAIMGRDPGGQPLMCASGLLPDTHASGMRKNIEYLKWDEERH